MSLAATLRRAPGRIVTGAFILNSGLGKLKGSEQTAVAVHGMAANAYPFLAKVPPKQFLTGLAVAETSLGAALLAPIVPARLAGAGLTAFSGGLLGMWWRTPGMHEGLRPTQQGTAVAKDVWMFGIGTSLLIDSIVTDTGQTRQTRKAQREADRAERKAALVQAQFGASTRRAERRAQARAAAKQHALAARAVAKEHAQTAREAAKEHAAEARQVARTQAKLQSKRLRVAATEQGANLRDLRDLASEQAGTVRGVVAEQAGTVREVLTEQAKNARAATQHVKLPG